MDPEGEYSRQLSGGDQLQAKGNFNSTTIAANDPEPSAPPIDEEFLLSASSLDPSAEVVGDLGTEDECALTRKMAAKGHHIVNGEDRDAFNPVAKAFACPIDSFANDDQPLAMTVPYQFKTHGLLSDDDASREIPCDAFSSTSATARATKTKLTNRIRAPGDAETASRSRLKKTLIEISPEKFGFLHGSEETWNAIGHGDCARVNCEACCAKLFCVVDADMVICPDCRCISAVHDAIQRRELNEHTEESELNDVGLGVLMDGLELETQQAHSSSNAEENLTGHEISGYSDFVAKMDCIGQHLHVDDEGRSRKKTARKPTMENSSTKENSKRNEPVLSLFDESDIPIPRKGGDDPPYK